MKNLSKDDTKSYLVKVYDTYAKQYNKLENKIDFTNSLSERSDKLKSELKAIRKRMDKYGFTPEDVKVIAAAIKYDDKKMIQQAKQGLQAFADHFNFSKEEGKQALKNIEEDARQYELTEANLEIVNWIIHKTGVNEYPDSIPLYNDLSEEEKEKVTSRGNPNFKESKITLPNDFEDALGKVMEQNPNWTQEAYADFIIDKYRHLSEKNLETVKRWIRKSDYWN